MGTPRAFLCGIAHELGAQRPLSELTRSAGCSETTLTLLQQRGLHAFCRETRPAQVVLHSAIANSLRAVGVHGRQIGAVIIAPSESDWSESTEAMLMETLRAGGIEQAALLGLGLQSCSQCSASIGLASTLLLRYPAVLVLMSGRIASEKERVFREGLTVFSDGVTSFLVTAAPGPYEVVAAEVSTNLNQGASEQRISRDVSVQGLRDIRMLCTRLFSSAGLRAADIKALCGSAVNRLSMQLMSEALGIDQARMYYECLPKYGHVHGSDSLLALTEHASSQPPRMGDYYLLVDWSPRVSGATLLRRAQE